MLTKNSVHHIQIQVLNKSVQLYLVGWANLKDNR